MLNIIEISMARNEERGLGKFYTHRVRWREENNTQPAWQPSTNGWQSKVCERWQKDKLSKAIKDRKLWRTMIANVLKGRNT